MAITAAEVNKLRQMTGAGMMDCKKALEESNGDYEKATEIIRKKGQLVAAKRADREATEGVVLANVSADATFGALTLCVPKLTLLQKMNNLFNSPNPLMIWLSLKNHRTSMPLNN